MKLYQTTRPSPHINPITGKLNKINCGSLQSIMTITDLNHIQQSHDIILQKIYDLSFYNLAIYENPIFILFGRNGVLLRDGLNSDNSQDQINMSKRQSIY
eukprot:UN08584